MKLLWCFIYGYITWIPLINAAIDVEKTVQQVQTILKTNSLLPRLSRDEIIQLLNDIRAEDSKSTSASREKSSEILTTLNSNHVNENENEISTITQAIEEKNNFVVNQTEAASTTVPSTTIESTTKYSGQKITVVLPYTPRDGSSLQELYTRPPRLEVVQEKVTPKPEKNLISNENINTLLNNAKIAEKQKLDIPAELREFLDFHGLKGNFAEDHFLLPLEGFKPLPPARIVDGEIQLPENILLTYDLISPADIKSLSKKEPEPAYSNNNFLYEPLRPELPLELDTSSSELKDTVLPLDLPTKPRKTKSISQLNYEPIDYDSVKVIPLGQGPNPVEDNVSLDTDPSKRQTNETSSSDETTTVTVPTSTVTTSTVIADAEPKDVASTTVASNSGTVDSVASDTDTGASIADLEDSFGGAAPVEPGDSVLPPPKKNGFYWMVDWNSFLEVGDGDSKVNIRFEPKLGDPQMFLPVNVP